MNARDLSHLISAGGKRGRQNVRMKCSIIQRAGSNMVGVGGVSVKQRISVWSFDHCTKGVTELPGEDAKIDSSVKAIHTGELSGCCRAAGGGRRRFGQREPGRRSQASLYWPEGASSCGEEKITQG